MNSWCFSWGWLVSPQTCFCLSPWGGSWNGCIHRQTKFVEVPSVDLGVLGRQVKCSELLFMAIDQETLLDRQAESVLECLNSQTL